MVTQSIDHEFVSIILQIISYTLYCICENEGVSPTLKRIFTPFPSEDKLFLFDYKYVAWYAKTNRISKKVVLWWESTSNNEKHEWLLFYNSDKCCFRL